MTREQCPKTPLGNKTQPALLGITQPLPDLWPELRARIELEPEGHPSERIVIVQENDGPEERYFISPFRGIWELGKNGQTHELCDAFFGPIAAVRHLDGHLYLHGSASPLLNIGLYFTFADETTLQQLQHFSLRVDQLDHPGRWVHRIAGSEAHFAKGPEAAAKIQRALLGHLKANCALIWSPAIDAAIRHAIRGKEGK